MKYIAVTIMALLISGSVIASDGLGLTVEEEATLRKSQSCALHKYSDDDKELIQLAYGIEFCASLVRLRDNDYKRGWAIHRYATSIVSLIDCDCSIHNHATNLAYNAFINVKQLLDEGTPIEDSIEGLCVVAYEEATN